MISIVLVTYNRLHLLRDVVGKTLENLSNETTEVIIWNNNSDDGTRDFLEANAKPHWKVVHHPENIGTNAFARALGMASGSYLIELDDDVIDAPLGWDRTLRQAADSVPRAGFLAANCIDDGKSVAAEILYRRDADKYERKAIGGIPLMLGPTGGWCTITPKAVYDEVGGFVENPKFTFWHEDGAYAKRVSGAGYLCAIVEDLKVFHASGPAYSNDSSLMQEKSAYYQWRAKRRASRHKVKCFIDMFPPIRWVNSKLKLYTIVDSHADR